MDKGGPVGRPCRPPALRRRTMTDTRTDYPDAVREWNAYAQTDACPLTAMVKADAAIRDLKVELERERIDHEYDVKRMGDARNAAGRATARAEKAEAEVKRVTKQRDRAEKKLDSMHIMERNADWKQRAEKAEAEVERLQWTYEPTDEQVGAALAEADAIIPLDEEQAEAFKALSESIKNEQSLLTRIAEMEAEVARLSGIIHGESPSPDSPEWDPWIRKVIGRCPYHGMELTRGSWHMHQHCPRERY